VLDSNRALFAEAIAIIKTLLIVSKYSKALEHMQVDEAFKSIP